MPKYLDQNGLVTLKSKLDERYANKYDACNIGYPTYHNVFTYALGDVVIYDGKLYQCISAIETAEEWTSAHWQQVAVDVNNVVTITSTGVQTDAIAAKILNAKALLYSNRLYTKMSSGAYLTFGYQWQENTMDHMYTLTYTVSSKSLSASEGDYNRVASIDSRAGDITTDASFEVTSGKVAKLTGKLPYLTTAPSADNTSGFITIVVLSAEPATRYNGFLYVITSSN